MTPRSTPGAAAVRTVTTTDGGTLTQGDAVGFLRTLPDATARLVVTSPWFTGPFPASSTDPTSPGFVKWLDPFLTEIGRVLRPDGSLVMELGCCWAKDAPVRTVQNFSAIGDLLAGGEWHLLQEFYWYNPGFLEADVEWADRRRERLDDCVSMWFWLARTPDVPVDVRGVRGFQNHLTRAYGNFLVLGDSRADDPGQDDVPGDASGERALALAERFPVALPEYFIRLLTREGELVVDPFAGTGATALAAETTGRAWACNDFSDEATGIAERRIDALRR
ncbi:DNA methyltransferase [Streptomyces sp. UNOB3_S3]|uniref:DNA methyltransferase n=1 Tax=Streptomyces sp. UNOB3_S3 TaxID=2871682 RepID=UPI0023AFD0E8|nr:DNA methyltransferase [Streptomyces sp. UNOB3_S3]MCC3778693.1 site-specific DNA-methyltransferase [Streptomyces sp. UNOB3_S3]